MNEKCVKSGTFLLAAEQWRVDARVVYERALHFTNDAFIGTVPS